MKHFQDTFGIKPPEKNDFKFWFIFFVVFCLLALNHCVLDNDSNTAKDSEKENTISNSTYYTWDSIQKNNQIKLSWANHYTRNNNIWSYSIQIEYFDFETQTDIVEYLDTSYFDEVNDTLIEIKDSLLQYDFEDYAIIKGIKVSVEYEKDEITIDEPKKPDYQVTIDKTWPDSLIVVAIDTIKATSQAIQISDGIKFWRFDLYIDNHQIPNDSLEDYIKPTENFLIIRDYNPKSDYKFILYYREYTRREI